MELSLTTRIVLTLALFVWASWVGCATRTPDRRVPDLPTGPTPAAPLPGSLEAGGATLGPGEPTGPLGRTARPLAGTLRVTPRVCIAPCHVRASWSLPEGLRGTAVLSLAIRDLESDGASLGITSSGRDLWGRAETIPAEYVIDSAGEYVVCGVTLLRGRAGSRACVGITVQ